MSNIMKNSKYTNNTTVTIVMDLITDKIDGVRKKVIDLVVEIINHDT